MTCISSTESSRSQWPPSWRLPVSQGLMFQMAGISGRCTRITGCSLCPSKNRSGSKKKESGKGRTGRGVGEAAAGGALCNLPGPSKSSRFCVRECLEQGEGLWITGGNGTQGEAALRARQNVKDETVGRQSPLLPQDGQEHSQPTQQP